MSTGVATVSGLSDVNLDEARSLLSNLEATQLSILNARSEYVGRTSDPGIDEALGWASVGSDGRNRDPAGAKADVDAMMVK
jgi:hypothetical protein